MGWLNHSGWSRAYRKYSAEKEFPGRDIYRGTEYIELVDFQKQFDQVVVVDVRSRYEYDTLQIIGAQNVPLHSPRFIEKIQSLRDANPGKKIVVYCNGKTCMKSYKAAAKCAAQGISNVVAFDAGIMDWAKAEPNRLALLGKSPVDPARLISKASFKERLVEPKAFSEMVANGDAMVLDVRDRYQRSGMSLFIGAETQAGLDEEEKLNKYIRRAGKQVRWLMYRLEEAGLKKYRFMKGGTRAFFKHMKERMKTS